MISFRNPSIIFILFSLIIAFFGFLKSIIFAKYLEFESLGLLALFQSVMALFGTLHFGVLSGGYRLSSFYNNERFKQLNGNIYSLLFILFTVFGIIIFLFDITGALGEKKTLIYASFVAGFISLLSNWAMNLSIARGNLASVNIAQLCGAAISLLSVLFIFDFGLTAAYISIILQPLVIILFLANSVDYTIPKSLRYDADLVYQIFKSGLFPFLAGLFFIAYQQLERILIGYVLNVEALGQLTIFYLVFTVWSIIPDSLNKILYPRLTKLMENEMYSDSKRILLRHFFFILIYCLVSSLFIFISLPVLVELFLPQHKEFVSFVHYGILVYIFKSLCETPSIYLLSYSKNNQILLTDFICFFSYVVFFLISYNTVILDIKCFIYIASSYFLLKFIMLMYLSFNAHSSRYVTDE